MNYLATIGDTRNLAENLRAAREGVGSGATMDGSFLRVDKHTGKISFGVEESPLPPGHRFAVGLHEITHGYLVSTAEKKVVERHMVPMAQGGARPTPPGGQYGTFERGGPRDAVEIGLSSIDEPGFKLTFTAWGPSNANRIGALLDKAITHLGSADGQAGFVHPVVVVKSGSYLHKTYGTVHHIDFDLVDWLNLDGKTLLSERGDGIGIAATKAEFTERAAEEPAPWDDEPAEEMTDAEREMLSGAA